MRLVRTFFRIVLIIASISLLYVGGMLVFLSITDFRPRPELALPVGGTSLVSPDTGFEINFITWNTGYAGLGRDASFFYDGGRQVRPTLDQFQLYLNGIYNLLGRWDTVDVILLQELDSRSKRSYYTDEVSLVSRLFPDYTWSFAANYRVRFVPLPLLDPLGKVSSGMLSLSRFKTGEALRLAAPVNFSWPRKIFHLDRCLLLTRYPLGNSRDLVVVNLHLSAWEEGASLRFHEMEQVRLILLKEYQLGHYVVAGGDWNQTPPAYSPGQISTGDRAVAPGDGASLLSMPDGWKWAFDPERPTNRDVDQPYRRGETPVSVIDCFLVSPNVTVKEVKTCYDGFAFSDHHPVYLRISLSQDRVQGTSPTPAGQ